MTLWVQTLAKVMLASLGLALVIKYIGPMLPIPASAGVALVAVLLPSVVMAIALALLSLQTTPPS